MHAELTIAELDHHFAIKGAAHVVTGNGGLPEVRVTTPQAAGEMYLHGAQVTSWKPAGTEEDFSQRSRPVERRHSHPRRDSNLLYLVPRKGRRHPRAVARICPHESLAARVHHAGRRRSCGRHVNGE